MPDSFLITCEHGGNRIPQAYQALFGAQSILLNSHRGYDSGALLMAKALTKAFNGVLVSANVSRLLIDLNRSIGHPQLFSDSTRALPVTARNMIITQYYTPYRTQVERFVSQSIAQGQRVIHISSHSFTPELNGIVRQADVGLLYDPGRHAEAQLCARWRGAIAALAPELRVRRNYPYAGKGDGLTSHLRRRYPVEVYLGIELEINQSLVFAATRGWSKLRASLIESLAIACTYGVSSAPLSATQQGMSHSLPKITSVMCNSTR